VKEGLSHKTEQNVVMPRMVRTFAMSQSFVGISCFSISVRRIILGSFLFAVFLERNKHERNKHSKFIEQLFPADYEILQEMYIKS
jgi:hypothetical protein